jgi:hypothetical protein
VLMGGHSFGAGDKPKRRNHNPPLASPHPHTILVALAIRLTTRCSMTRSHPRARVAYVSSRIAAYTPYWDF